MKLEQFKALVDKFAREVESLDGEPGDILAWVDVQPDRDANSDRNYDAIYETARSVTANCRGVVADRCRMLIHELIQRHVIEGEELAPYLTMAERLRGWNGGASDLGDPVPTDAQWRSSIRLAVAAKRIMELRGYPEPSQKKLIAYRSAEEAARAAKRLLAQGYAIDRQDGEIRLEEKSEVRLVAELEKRVAAHGGLGLARRLFTALATRYDPVQERHHVGRRTTPFGEGAPQVPLGYLLQLAAKHPVGRKPLRATGADAKRLMELATDYAAVLEVQPYVSQMFIGGDASSMFHKLRETAIYDFMFCLPQLRPRDALGIAAEIVHGVELPSPIGSGWTLSDALEVSRAIVERSAGKTGPHWIDPRDIARCCPHLPMATVGHVLAEGLSHPLSGANQGLLSPLAAHGTDGSGDPGVDFFAKPLLNMGSQGYLLFDRSMCGPAFLEALLAPAQKAFENFNGDHVGHRIEALLRKALLAHGVESKAGKYRIGKTKGECDLVIETNDKVILMEVKKKALTGKARAGSDVFVILDLARSVVKAHVQAARHELLLRQGHALELRDNDGSTHRVSLDGRDVERVAVSLPDFGGFQDRQLLMGFFESHLGAQYTVKDPQYQERFDDLGKTLAAFQDVEAELRAMKPPDDRPFHHCWFLSIPQLMVLLDDVTDAESFWNELGTTRSITWGSLDWYWEHAHMKSMLKEADDASIAKHG